VSIEAKPHGGSWSVVATTTTDVSGNYSASVRPSRQMEYRAHFSGETGVVQAYSSPTKTITPQAYLTMPSKPRRVYAGRTFSSHGYLKPRHTVGAKSVAIKCYKWSSSARDYSYHHTVWAKNGEYTSSGTRYSGRVRLPHKGKWKLVARTWGGTDHATTYSSPRYLNAR
jgi:hypothetical protein